MSRLVCPSPAPATQAGVRFAHWPGGTRRHTLTHTHRGIFSPYSRACPATPGAWGHLPTPSALSFPLSFALSPGEKHSHTHPTAIQPCTNPHPGLWCGCEQSRSQPRLYTLFDEKVPLSQTDTYALPLHHTQLTRQRYVYTAPHAAATPSHTPCPGLPLPPL